MTKTGKSKPCLSCQSKNLTASEKLQQTIDTRSTVCFQSLNEFAGYAFNGVFAGMHRGVDRWMRMFGQNEIVVYTEFRLATNRYTVKCDSLGHTGWIQ